MADLENNSIKKYKIDFNNRKINLNKSAFKDKTDIKIFNFLDKSGCKDGILDTDELFNSTSGFDFNELDKTVITDSEIKNLLLKIIWTKNPLQRMMSKNSLQM